MLDYDKKIRKDIFLIGERNGIRKSLKIGEGSMIGATGRISCSVHFNLGFREKDKYKCMFLSLWGDPTKAVSISGFPRPLFSEARGKPPTLELCTTILISFFSILSPCVIRKR